MRALALIAAALLPAVAAQAAPRRSIPVVCAYQPVEPASGKVRADVLTLDLGPAVGGEAKAWKGPLTVTQQDGNSCTADAAFAPIEGTLYSDGQHLLVTTSAAGGRKLVVLSATSCQPLWKSAGFTGAVRLKDGILYTGKTGTKLNPDCLPLP
ncbi:hypothetical protein [Nitrospirillum iridis]|uniref:mRNA-degrading endonuclease toxin of MazEF toxin-antitoxin module n=1 Tax=Nitrospirillum iridis TaxID=765888 RepID=A0A7X0B419_9PROT|nr:hypothetical protein [Nitrospirillum iridis]MBB6255293.1 mRNA-degrading endonuclease toxin of MazEF toxin-antitoxin module [Nitrospirillum iridis]